VQFFLNFACVPTTDLTRVRPPDRVVVTLHKPTGTVDSSTTAAAHGKGKGKSNSTADLKPRGAHAWARLRLADPVEAGHDLGSHLTRRGFARILLECARVCVMLRDGADFAAIADNAIADNAIAEKQKAIAEPAADH